MKEELLHYIWRSKMLMKQTLRTIDGETLRIVHAGTLNKDAGPDFFNAKVKIGNTLWVGNIEIHLKSSDWKNHNHQSDKKYNNVILHVVYHHDTEIQYENGKSIPCLELKEIIPPFTLRKYHQLMLNQNAIACEKIIRLPSSPVLMGWFGRLMVERLQGKCIHIESLLMQNKQNWENMFYVLTAKYFGMKTNAQPFEWLAQNLPISVLSKHKNSLIQIEALIFGVSGFLESDIAKNDYLNLMKREFDFMKKKYNLKAMDKSIWKFARTRPANFPTVRLAQLASLIFQSSHLLSRVLDAERLDVLISLYKIKPNKNLNPFDFITHKTKVKTTEFGTDAIEILMINTVFPVIFLYGKLHDKETLAQRALSFYEQMKTEDNAIIRFWRAIGINPKTALDSQALIQLKTDYCANLKCLNCIIGNEILLNRHE